MTRSNGSDTRRETRENPKAGARRRLLRAIGKSGGVTLGALLAGAWTRPTVKAVLLPAHAQISVVGCPLAVMAEFDLPGFADYSMSVLVGDGGGPTVLASTAVPGAGNTSSPTTVFLSGSSQFPPGTYLAGFRFAEDNDDAVTGLLTVSCCVLSSTTTVQSTTGVSLFLAPQIGPDDGECQIYLNE